MSDKIKIEEIKLLQDLAQQIENHKNQNTPDSELILRISDVELNFEFNFEKILKGLRFTKTDKIFRLICPYIVYFRNITFKQKVNFSSVVFNQKISFLDIAFSQDAGFTVALFSQKVSFTNTTFSENVNFSGTTFSENLTFNNTTFSNTNFDGTIFIKDVNFRNITFEQNVIFNTVKFNKYVEFNKVHFKQSTDFKDSIIKSSEWFAIKFDKDADFKRVNFGDTVLFHHVYFGDIGAFWNIKGKYIQFDNIHLLDKSNIYFGYINQNKLEDNKTWEIIEDHKNSKLDFTNTMIKGIVNFNTGNNIEKINFEGSQVNDNLSIELSTEKCANWETACILKNEELKRNNTIKALEYQAKEKKLYTKHLHDNKTWSNLLDRFSLLLGKIVNNHGMSWGRALLFTLWVWIFSFTIFSLPNYLFWDIFKWEVLLIAMSYLLCKNSKLSKQTLLYVFYLVSLGILFYVGRETINWGDYLEGLIEYFVPTKYDTLIDYVRNFPTDMWLRIVTICGIVVYFIGKIFIPYGVYEVIKAFRKYR